MTWFTDSPFERMMTQKPGHERRGDDTPPVPHSPACNGCPYSRGQLSSISQLIKPKKDEE